jgi:hypothetical protein
MKKTYNLPFTVRALNAVMSIRRLTQNSIVRFTGRNISNTHFNKILSGNRRITPEYMKLLTDKLHIEADELAESVEARMFKIELLKQIPAGLTPYQVMAVLDEVYSELENEVLVVNIENHLRSFLSFAVQCYSYDTSGYLGTFITTEYSGSLLYAADVAGNRLFMSDNLLPEHIRCCVVSDIKMNINGAMEVHSSTYKNIKQDERGYPMYVDNMIRPHRLQITTQVSKILRELYPHAGDFSKYIMSGE